MSVATYFPRMQIPIWAYIQTLYRSPTASSIQEAQYIFFSEDHFYNKADSCHSDHAAVIDQTVTPGSVLLMEGFTAMAEVTGEDKEAVLNKLRISETARSKITVIGWDRYNHASKLGKLEHKGQLIQAVIPGLIEAREAFIEEEMEDFNLPKEMQKVIDDISNRIDKILIEALTDDHPMRTASMVDTIEKIEQQRLEGKITGKIYIVGGVTHLSPHYNKGNDPRLSLKPLYDRIATLSATVISSRKTYQVV